MGLEVGDVVMCTVERIAGTVVFVNIDDYKIQGNIVLSEIAPGRIRNLREYVVPNKKIICKVLNITNKESIHLSLRRVTQREQKDIKERHTKERSYKNILKSVLKEKYDEVIAKISEQKNLFDFIQEVKENSKELEKLVDIEESKRIIEILKSEKQKKSTIKRIIYFNTPKPDGIEIIKKALCNIKDAEIRYLSAGKYSIKVESTDIKKADNRLKQILNEIIEDVKNNKIEVTIK